MATLINYNLNKIQNDFYNNPHTLGILRMLYNNNFGATIMLNKNA